MIFVSQLAAFASVTSYGTILFVLACFLAMVFAIRKYRLMDFTPSFSSVVRVTPSVSEQRLEKVELPFSIEVKSQSLKTLDDIELVLNISSEVRHHVCVLTNIPWVRLSQIINKPLQEYKDSLLNPASLEPFILHSAEHGPSTAEDIAVCKKTFAEDGFNYPFVVAQTRLRNDTANEENSVSSMITLIQVEVSGSRTTSSVIGQYLKFSDSRVLNLQRLYPSRGDHREETDCVVCWCRPAARVLLPCRHACVCDNCLGKLASCPVCRSRVFSHFSL